MYNKPEATNDGESFEEPYLYVALESDSGVKLTVKTWFGKSEKIDIIGNAISEDNSKVKIYDKAITPRDLSGMKIKLRNHRNYGFKPIYQL